MDLKESSKYAKALKLTDKEKEYLSQFSGQQYSEEKKKIQDKKREKIERGSKGENIGYNRGKKYETMSDSLKLQILADDTILKPQEVCDKYGISRQQLYKLRANTKASKSNMKLVNSTEADEKEEGLTIKQVSSLMNYKPIADVNAFIDDRIGAMGEAYDNLLSEMCNKDKISDSRLSEIVSAFNAIAGQMEKVQNKRDGIANVGCNTNIVIMPQVIQPNSDYDNIVIVGDTEVSNERGEQNGLLQGQEQWKRPEEVKSEPIIIG